MSKTKVTDIKAAQKAKLKENKWRWIMVWLAVIALTIFEGASTGNVQISIYAAAGVVSWMLYAVRNVRGEFWKAFAADNKWIYKKTGDASQEAGLIFNKGNTGSRIISHVIEAKSGERLLRFFEYQFTTGSGDDKTTYFFTVFEYTMQGTFPHIYLDSKFMTYRTSMTSVGVKVPLPGDMKKNFTLWAPEQYEIEALEIFTADVLAFIEEQKFALDVEIVDSEVIFYRQGNVNSRDELTKAHAAAQALIEKIGPRLDRFKLYTIGDKKAQLT